MLDNKDLSVQSQGGDVGAREASSKTSDCINVLYSSLDRSHMSGRLNVKASFSSFECFVISGDEFQK